MSNGGRSYQPWNDRHLRTIGLEDVCGHFHLGHSAFGRSEVTQIGPDGSVEVRHTTRGSSPTNTAFALNGSCAAVTEVSGDAFERLEPDCKGASLVYPTFNL